MFNPLMGKKIGKIADNDYVGFDGVFKADARSEERETGKATVTNFYVEDGSQVSDHIIVDARTLTISGEIAEVTFREEIFSQDYSTYQKEIGNIGIFLPNKTRSQTQILNKYVNQASSLKSQYEDTTNRFSRFGKYLGKVLGNDSLKNLIGSDENVKKSIQAEFIKMIREYHQKKMLMKVETLRYGIFENMAITGYAFNTVDDNYFSYSVDFQEIRKVITVVTPVKEIAKNPTGTQAKNQTANKQDKGVVQGKDLANSTNPKDKQQNESLATKIKNIF